MMQKLVTLLLLTIPLVSFAQNKNEELITWSGDKRLTWADYKGKVQTGTDAAASTATSWELNTILPGTDLTTRSLVVFQKQNHGDYIKRIIS